MDFRPLGDGISCVAVAMPHVALLEGHNRESAPELRRIYAAVRGAGCRGRQVGCLSLAGSLMARLKRRVTNQKGNARREDVGRATRALASRLKKDGTRLIRAGQLPGEAQWDGELVGGGSGLFQYSDSASVETPQRSSQASS
jgi:hypothetical protein